MAVLHVLNRNTGPEALCRQLARAEEGDAFLFIGEAVYLLAVPASYAQLAQFVAKGQGVYVLAGDAVQRGIAPERWPSGVLGVDYGGFVDLATTHAQVLSWN